MKGLIVFIDILGYQSFLENNSAEETARNVLKMIRNLPRSINDEIKPFFNKLQKDSSDYSADQDFEIEDVVFSDTIVLLLKNNNNHIGPSVNNFVYISVISLKLMAELFAAGLPSRGVIHLGEFMKDGSCLAGRGIAESFRLCGNLDFSGIVLSDELRGWYDKQDHGLVAKKILVDYLVPLRDGGEKKMICLNWYSGIKNGDRSACKLDVIQFVSEAFWKHNKDLPVAVDSKIRNTCKLIRKFIMLEKAFPRKVDNGGTRKTP